MMPSDRLAEPYDPTQRPVRWTVLMTAALVALALSWFAPRPWAGGPGKVELLVGEEVVLSEPIELGSGEPIARRTEIAGRPVVLRLPAGAPVAAPIEARIEVAAAGDVEILGDLRLVLVLPDGSRELVPVMRVDKEAGFLVAHRRPPMKSPVLMGLLGLVVVLWVSEAIPLFVTSLLVPIVIVAAGAGPASGALAPFFHPIIALFFGGFLMAEAMRRVGLDRLAALAFVGLLGKTPTMLYATLLGVAAFLSMWMSNTAATAVLVPIALAVSEPLDNLPYRKTLVLGIAYAATVGGVGSAIGTPANPLAIEFLDSFAGHSLSFVDWFAFGLPMVVLFLPVMGVFLWVASRCRVDPSTFAAARDIAQAQLSAVRRLTRAQWQVLVVFVIVMGLWLTQQLHGIDTGVVALIGVALLSVQRLLEPEDLGRISWASLITFGGGLSLGVHLVSSGTSDWLATRLVVLSQVPGWLGIVALALVTLGLTTAASNTASAAILVPLAIPLAGVLGVDPVALVAVVAITSSIDFALVIGTPPTMIAYSTELFTAREIFRRGIPLDFIGIAILVTAVLGVWHLAGVV
jgi:sodium-dependent dicarboxylate transporter 2/3/5